MMRLFFLSLMHMRDCVLPNSSVSEIPASARFLRRESTTIVLMMSERILPRTVWSYLVVEKVKT